MFKEVRNVSFSVIEKAISINLRCLTIEYLIDRLIISIPYFFLYLFDLIKNSDHFKDCSGYLNGEKRM